MQKDRLAGGIRHETENTARNGTALDGARDGGLLWKLSAHPVAAAHDKVRTVADNVRRARHGRVGDDEYAAALLRLSHGQVELQPCAAVHCACRRCSDLHGRLCRSSGGALSARRGNGDGGRGVSSALVDARRTDGSTGARQRHDELFHRRRKCGHGVCAACARSVS